MFFSQDFDSQDGAPLTSVSTITKVCGGALGSGIVDVLSGGQIATDLGNCLYSSATIIDSVGAVVRWVCGGQE